MNDSGMSYAYLEFDFSEDGKLKVSVPDIITDNIELRYFEADFPKVVNGAKLSSGVQLRMNYNYMRYSYSSESLRFATGQFGKLFKNVS